MMDVSRRKIKKRMDHALEKKLFKEHLAKFLEIKQLKPRGERECALFRPYRRADASVARHGPLHGSS